jgi:carbamoyl-phosphate synthase large subunit
MKKISEYREELGSYIDMIVINRKEVIDLTIDKWKMFLFMKMNGLIAIESTLECEDYNYLLLKYGKEFLVKPRSSYSSRGVKIICDQETFNYYKYLLGKQMMAQEVVGDSDHEFTAAAFCYGDGTCSAPIIFKRHLSFEGATLNAEVVDSQPISDSIMSLVSLLKPVGPTNFQYRTRKDCAYLLEINPRISASTSLRAAFGFNEAEMAIRFYLEKETDLRPCIKKGKATRYISDYVELL